MGTAVLASMPVQANLSTPRKRNHEGEIIAHHSIHAQGIAELTSSHPTPRQSSPTPSNASSELTELTSTGIASPTAMRLGLDGTSEVSTPASAPAKKRKLTFAEKEVEKAVRQREREEKARLKAEEKARKEEDKRLKDEEKRKKEEEKEADRRAKELEKAEKKKARDAEKQEKDAERAKKEAEKQDKEQEKLKKERSQLRIGAFFGRPALQSTPPATPDDVSIGASSRRSSIAAIDIAEPVLKIDNWKPANPDFEKYIIPYFIHENTDIAPTNRFRASRSVDVFQGKQSEYKLDIGSSEIEPLRTRFGAPKKRMKLVKPVKNIMESIQATQLDSIDFIGDCNPLKNVPYKILSFREDIRPPYIGTYTRQMETKVAHKLSRKPTYRGRPDTNYDYDSEAEWEEPAADDEEILDDAMSESDGDEEEEMEDFLDDEEDQGRRRMFAGEMEPISSGLCFQGEDFHSNGHNMEDYRMAVLHDSTSFPINPFSTEHWSDIGKSTSTKANIESNNPCEPHTKNEIPTKSMPPPRVPLATVNPSNILNNYLTGSGTSTALQSENVQSVSKQRGRPLSSNKDLKIISAEFMDDFKKAIDGSDLTKAGLIEILKKQFPKCSKDAIKDTLGVVAVRVGKKEAEKKWKLI